MLSKPFLRSFKPNLLSTLFSPFTIDNYMKKFNPANLKRYHGRVRVDPYFEHFSVPQNVDKFIKEEAKHYSKESEQWKTRTTSYYEKVNERKDTRDQSEPEIYDEYEYKTKVSWYEGRQYAKVYRTKIQTSKEEQLLDIMKYSSLKQHYNTVTLLKIAFSPSHRYLAFGFDLLNDERTTFMIKDLKKDNIVGVKGWEDNQLKDVSSVVFDGQEGIFYTKMKDHRSNELWYQNIHSGEKQLIYSENNIQFYLNISASKDEKILFLTCVSKEGSKLYALNMNQKPFKVFQIMKQSSTDKVFANGYGNLLVLWKDTPEGHVVIKRNQKGEEEVIYRGQEEETFTDMDLFENWIVLYGQKINKPIMKIIELDSENNVKAVQAPEMPYLIGTVAPSANKSLKATKIQVYFSNIFVYNEVYEYDFIGKKWSLKEKFSMTGPPIKPQNYLIKNHEVPTPSGQTIPLTVVVPKKNKKVRNKMILHSYGYYGISYDISFNSTYLVALQKGWSLAYAHIRGGSEKGRGWHQKARKEKRAISWNDLEDCVAFLIKEDYTHPNILVLHSHSAGAITVWNSMNRNPHLFKAAVLVYPFLDVLGTLLDDKQPISQSDYAQYGNPLQNLSSYNQIQSYSPYETISEKQYPFLFIVGGNNDYRCPVSQIAKFVTKFREKAIENQRYSLGRKGCLVQINDGSHEGVANIKEQLWNGCEILASLDYLLEECSHDCSLPE